MAKTTAVFQTKGYKCAPVNLDNSSGTTTVEVLTAGADDSVVKSLSITSTDTTARVLELIIKVSGVEYLVNALSIAIGAGSTATAAVDGLSAGWSSLDRVGKKVLPLPAGAILCVRMQTAITAGKQIAVVAISEEY